MMLVWRNSPIDLRCDQWDDALDECEDECGLVPVGGGGVGAKNPVVRGEGEGAEAGALGGGAGRGGGGRKVEHVPDSERPFRGRGFRLRWVCGVPL